MNKSLKQEWYIYAILLITILTRFLFLELRPPHFDEGINGYFVDQMWIKGFFDYDPTNYHGPLHFYFLQAYEVIFGRGIASFRMVVATLSVLTVVLMLMHRQFIGQAAVWAALVIALSPGAMFMGRYAIHEAWLPFSLVLFNYGFMRWFHKKDIWSYVWFFGGMALALMNKETAVIHFFVWTVSFIYLLVFHKKEFNKSTLPSLEDVFIGITWVLIAIFVVYSAFGLQVDQFADFFKGFLPWMKTGTSGMGHEKAWYYWLQIAQAYEFWVFVALLFGILFMFKKNAWFNYFFINSLGTLIIYTLIKYKTPWCSLSIFTFFPFLLSMGMAQVSRSMQKLMYAGFALMMVWEVYALVQINYVNYTKEGEFYVYVHTTKDYLKITNSLERAVKDQPHIKNMDLILQLDSPWPLNWQLGKFPNIRYNIDGNDMLRTSVIVIDQKHVATLEPALKKTFLKQKLRVRHHMDEVFAYFAKDIFEKYGIQGEVVGPK